jgi:choline dehydrogenase-like flavoprotein
MVTDSSGKTVKLVEVQLGDDPNLATFTADVVAVCCGAINSAALLLQSANDKHPDGLANSSGQVGRNFMYHQADAILAVSLKKTRGIYMKTVSVNDFYFGDRDYPFPMGNIQPLGSFHYEMIKANFPLMTKVIPDFALKLMALRAVPWWLTTEDLPDPNNRVSLVNGRIQIQYKPNNVDSFLRLRDKWIEILKQAGHAQHWVNLHAYFKKQVPLEGVGHQNGTCRFGTNPKDSVLDVNCRTHDIDNLYVVDGSFFPSCGAVNPCLTIIANALRVADHLLERLK